MNLISIIKLVIERVITKQIKRIKVSLLMKRMTLFSSLLNVIPTYLTYFIISIKRKLKMVKYP